MRKVGSLFGRRRGSDMGMVSPFHLAPRRGKEVKVLGRVLRIRASGGDGVAGVAISLRSPLTTTVITSDTIRGLRRCVASCHAHGTGRSCSFRLDLYRRCGGRCFRTRRRCTGFTSTGHGIVLRAIASRGRELRGGLALTRRVCDRSVKRLRILHKGIRRTGPIFTMMRPTAMPLIPTSPGGVLVVVTFTFLTFIFRST